MRALCIVALCGVMSCATFRTMTVPAGELEDYRAFRVAAAPGTRLSRARQYLDKHPRGAFSAEVQSVWDDEEPRYFQAAQLSQEGLRRYLADLPAGPHAEAALALLVAFGSNMKEAELADLARHVRYEDAKLETAAEQRRAVPLAILGALGVLLDDETYRSRRSDAPPALRSLMLGQGASTWGAVPLHRENDYFFLLPTRPERESRLVTLEVTLTEDKDRLTGARLEGSDMLVRWAEADQIVRLDPSLPDDRMEAQVYTLQRLEGALERRFPKADCPDLRKDRELFHRGCKGWEGIVISGQKAGDKDAIILRAGHAKKDDG